MLKVQHNTLRPDLNLMLLFSKDLNALHMDANAGYTHFSHRASFLRNEFVWGIALDGPVSEVIGWATESWSIQRLLNHSSTYSNNEKVMLWLIR